MRLFWVVLLASSSAACAPTASEADLRSASRSASAPSSAGPAPLSPPVDLDALAQVLTAAQATPPPAEGAEERIGRPTGLPDVPTEAPTDGRPQAAGHVGTPLRESPLAGSALERRARRELYFALVKRCSSRAEPLPPNAVQIRFLLAPDGRIEPVSIRVTAEDPTHAAAAACMRKELAASPFRGPRGPKGVRTPVDLTAPSVD